MGEILVFSGADDQARGEFAPGNFPAIIIFGVVLPAPDEMHDFQLVTLGKFDRGKGRARHDFEVALHRHLAGIEIELGKESGKAGAGRDAAQIAVED